MRNEFAPQNIYDESQGRLEQTSKFENLVLETCYNKPCEIINEDKFVHEHLLELQNHDLATLQHSLEVGNISAFLINKLGNKLKEEEAKNLMASALLHDYGKTKLDPNILNKKTALSSEDRSEINKHAEASSDSLKDWNETVGLIVGAHHRFQKNSYGIDLDELVKNKEALKLTKILAVVDAFQAMMDPSRPSNRQGLKSMDEISRELNEKFASVKENSLIIEAIFLLEEYYYQEIKKSKTTTNIIGHS